jgi:lipooligosaccharide transport system ATP-binding protein
MDEAEQLCDRLMVMDRGMIAAEGSPRELIERYSTPEVLELRFDPAEHQQAADKLAELAPQAVVEGESPPVGLGPALLADVPAERVEALADRILLYAQNGDTALAAVRGLGLEPLTSLVRRSTLEDVFLRLTGRRLED